MVTKRALLEQVDGLRAERDSLIIDLGRARAKSGDLSYYREMAKVRGDQVDGLVDLVREKDEQIDSLQKESGRLAEHVDYWVGLFNKKADKAEDLAAEVARQSEKIESLLEENERLGASLDERYYELEREKAENHKCRQALDLKAKEVECLRADLDICAEDNVELQREVGVALDYLGKVYPALDERYGLSGSRELPITTLELLVQDAKQYEQREQSEEFDTWLRFEAGNEGP